MFYEPVKQGPSFEDSLKYVLPSSPLGGMVLNRWIHNTSNKVDVFSISSLYSYTIF